MGELNGVGWGGGVAAGDSGFAPALAKKAAGTPNKNSILLSQSPQLFKGYFKDFMGWVGGAPVSPSHLNNRVHTPEQAYSEVASQGSVGLIP